jgi:hypothetical protein
MKFITFIRRGLSTVGLMMPGAVLPLARVAAEAAKRADLSSVLVIIARRR